MATSQYADGYTAVTGWLDRSARVALKELSGPQGSLKGLKFEPQVDLADQAAGLTH